MSKTPWHAALIVLAIILLSPAALSAQATKPQPQKSQIKAEISKASQKLNLQSLTLVSPEAAARKVAEEASARAQEPKAVLKNPKQSGNQQGAGAAVNEFQPVEGPAADSAAAPFQIKDHKKSLLKNFHGSAYGVAGSGIGRASGESAAAGADSGNSKFHIYLEGEHAHTNPPASH